MFQNCKTPAERKALFRKLSKKAHPDKGGTNQEMADLIKAYEQAEKVEDTQQQTRRNGGHHKPQNPPGFEDAFNAAFNSHRRSKGAQPQPDPNFSWETESEFPYESAFKRQHKHGMPKDAIRAGDEKLEILEHCCQYFTEEPHYNRTLVRQCSSEINSKGWLSHDSYQALKDMHLLCSRSQDAEWEKREKAKQEAYEEQRARQEAEKDRASAEMFAAYRREAEKEMFRKECEIAALEAQQEKLKAERDIARIEAGKSWATRAYDWAVKRGWAKDIQKQA